MLKKLKEHESLKKNFKKIRFFFPKKSQTGNFLLSFNRAEIVESDMRYCGAYSNIHSESTYNKKNKIEKVPLRWFSSRFLKVAEPEQKFKGIINNGTGNWKSKAEKMLPWEVYKFQKQVAGEQIKAVSDIKMKVCETGLSQVEHKQIKLRS